jgi:hypothetical protein
MDKVIPKSDVSKANRDRAAAEEIKQKTIHSTATWKPNTSRSRGERTGFRNWGSDVP